MEYTNSKISELIDEYIHVQKYRGILKSRLIDGETFDMLAEHYCMSVRQIKNIVYKGSEKVFRHL